MILSAEVEMQLGKKNHTFLKKKYNLDSNLEPGDIFKISIGELSRGSKYIVSVSCDYCGVILNVPYKRYNKSTEVINKYACSSKDCSSQKIKDVCNIKYGVDNPFQSTSVKEKSKDTLDYYDGEYIRDNFTLHRGDRCYPHFDHKVSVFYGFLNNIDPNIIGSIENICITKQWINGLKGELCEEEFKIKMGTVGSHLD